RSSEESGVLQARLNLITADPLRLDDSVKFIETDVRPAVENELGNLGMSLYTNPELGVAVLTSFWVSRDALRHSEEVARPAAERRSSAPREPSPWSDTVSRFSSARHRRERGRRSGSH